MKGHIRERGKGNWWAVLEGKDPETGKRKRQWQRLEAKGKHEAQGELADLISQKKSDTYMPPAKTTLREFLEKRWLPRIKPNVELRTYERYEDLALKNIAPLSRPEADRAAVGKHLAGLCESYESGRRDGKGGSSPRTVHHNAPCAGESPQAGSEIGVLLFRNPCSDLDKNDRPKIIKKTVATICGAAKSLRFGGSE